MRWQVKFSALYHFQGILTKLDPILNIPTFLAVMNQKIAPENTFVKH